MAINSKNGLLTYFFILKNNTTTKGLLHSIDGFSLSTVDFFILSERNP